VDIRAFQHLYSYHFRENRELWERFILPLSPGQFEHEHSYSKGSLGEQLRHLISVDNNWFSDISGSQEFIDDQDLKKLSRQELALRWREVEDRMSNFLRSESAKDLHSQPITTGEDKELFLWQILFHVINHGTDHRAQILRQLNDMGIQTTSQDYLFYAYDNKYEK
jgi:uncharacterized damage-inducible protein DinB